MPVRAVLFDFDFTLADPSPRLLPAWTEALGAIGVSRPEEATLVRVVGRPLRAQYSMIVGQPASGERFETFERAYREYRDGHAPLETRIFPAVTAALEKLHRSGLALGVVSTGAANRVIPTLIRSGLRRFFRVAVPDSRDKAAGIHAAVRWLGVDAAAAIYVGDHPEDYRAATDAGVRFIAVKTGVHSEADFPEDTLVLSSVADLPAQLAGL